MDMLNKLLAKAKPLVEQLDLKVEFHGKLEGRREANGSSRLHFPLTIDPSVDLPGDTDMIVAEAGSFMQLGNSSQPGSQPNG